MMKLKPKKVNLYVLGDKNAGKMSIIHSFVHEEYVKTSEESDFDGIPSEIL
eukprot:TRINITY_DN132_c0_g1_i2.p5 TRINITY_DN132_c0_g1~~TRINITY_DN132_c0_g1_i2.p5  ORF type:complete len:51 (-),score=15.87 TRINITY_DN132_c0_g1_i2:573-725(-)